LQEKAQREEREPKIILANKETSKKGDRNSTDGEKGEKNHIRKHLWKCSSSLQDEGNLAQIQERENLR